MRFPLRLSVDLTRARILGAFSGSASPIVRFSPLVKHLSREEGIGESSVDLERHSAEDCVRLAGDARSPVVWIGGTEPLFHPEIGAVTGALVQSGRHVFLHTNGLSLRNRIHEFQPHSRLFLTIEFGGRERTHDSRLGQPGAFRRALESIRAVKLSGFLVCAHVTVDPESDACEIGQLFEFLDKKDLDGFIVSSGGATPSAALDEKLDDIRNLIRSKPWERFSKLLESAHTQPATETVRPALPGSGTRAFEEAD